MVRNRYVTQVLLATFGFGLLLVVVAVLQTPGDPPLQNTRGSSRPLELRQSPAGAATPPRTTGATRHRENLKADCDLPAKGVDDCPQPDPQKICERTSGSHEKEKALAN
ncbi:MAG: hypothetical protein JSS69_08335 [Acidobacteria bacterium]|nr:hypothetical protein [Acidobacteriota bacterium]MBS1865912.1 hypothetical protein [Acidobacteriota bacterium]